MKNILTTLLLICATCYTWAQKPITGHLNIQGNIRKDCELTCGSFLKKGTPAILQYVTKLKKYDEAESAYQAVLWADGKQRYMSINRLEELFLTERLNKNQFWQLVELSMVKYYAKNNDHKDLRREQILEAESYIKELEKANLFYDDAAIEDYLQCLMLEIMPETHVFRKDLQKPVVRILKSASPDIMTLSNNMLLISTGMLTTLDTEDELIAILSREVSHYLLDHALITVKKNIARANRAKFWGAVADGVVAATEEFLYERYDHYTPGLLFATNDIVQSLINQNIANRMGMDYSESQEKEADKWAVSYLENEGRNTSALCSALHKIKAHYQRDKTSDALTKYGIYGTLLDRVNSMEPPVEQPEDRKYLRTMMSVVSYEAAMHDYNKDYPNAQRLAMKNIKHSLATADDYLMMARGLMKQSNTPENNAECMLYLDKADMVSEVEDVNITKMRILLLLREKNHKEAIEQLKKYQQLLDIMYQQPHTEEDAQWITEEHAWAKKLLERIFML